MMTGSAGLEPARSAALTNAEAARRAAMLAALREALVAQGVESILARYHHLVLGATSPFQYCRAGDPQLHVSPAPGSLS